MSNDQRRKKKRVIKLSQDDAMLVLDLLEKRAEEIKHGVPIYKDAIKEFKKYEPR